MIYSWKVCYRTASGALTELAVAADRVDVYENGIAEFVIGDATVAAYHGWSSIERLPRD